MSIQRKLVALSAVIVAFASISALTSWSIKTTATQSLHLAESQAVPELLSLTEAKGHFNALQTSVMQIALWSVMNGEPSEKNRFVQSFSDAIAALDEAEANGLLPSESYQAYRGRIVNAMTLVQRNPRIGFAAVRGAQLSYEELTRDIEFAGRLKTQHVRMTLDEAMAASNLDKITAAFASLIVIVAAVWGGVFVGRSVGGPIVQIARAMENLAHGDLKASAGLKSRNDEVGVLLSAMEVFRSSAVKLREQEKKARKQAAEERERGDLLDAANKRTKTALKELENAKKEIEIVALLDGLTGLSNRLSLEAILRNEGSSAKDFDGNTVIAIDLDRFKEVNDSYGHEAGDAILVETGKRLKRFIDPDRDKAFRIGGDEFVLIVAIDERSGDAHELCNDILFDILQPITHKGVNLTVGASIGFARKQADEAISATLHRADLALYNSKSEGRFRVTSFSESIGRAHEEKISLTKELKGALERNEIEIYLQPKVRADDWELTGCEVLARWNNANRGMIMPDTFFSIAEEAKLTADIDRRVFELANDAIALLEQEEIYLDNVSINISQQRLTHPDFVKDMAAQPGLGTSPIAFEVLETAFLDYTNATTAECIDTIKSYGIDIYVDDFGTGHASLASVIGLRPRGVKIDKMFVPGIDTSQEKMGLVKSLIDIAYSVDAVPIVEGVESSEEAKVLQRLGANTLQGYFFSRPLPPKDFVDWAKDWRAKRLGERSTRSAS